MIKGQVETLGLPLEKKPEIWYKINLVEEDAAGEL